MLIAVSPYLEGVFYSLFFLLALGPAFFYLLSLAINQGLKPALFFASGVIFSDIVITSAVYFGLGKWFEQRMFQEVFSVLGGLLIVFFGIKFILIKEAKIDSGEPVKGTTLVGNCIKGFLMNILNPFAFLVWITLMAKLKLEHKDYGDAQFFKFFLSFFMVLIIVEFGKAVMAHKIRPFLTQRVILVINKILGLIFVAVGIWLFCNFFQLYFNLKWN